MADWLEQLPKAQDLVVWNSTTINSSVKPIFDEKTRRWQLTVNRDGRDVTLRPAHIIVATGVLGSPRIPVVKEESLFTGSVLHASKFKGGRYFTDKRVLVVGAGNTGADIAQDCVMRGAREVTLLQRSSTCTISAKTLAEAMAIEFPEEEDPDVSDFKYQAFPIGLHRQWAIEDREKREKKDEDLHKKLLNKGVKLNQGRDGSGQHLLIFERWGGLFIHFLFPTLTEGFCDRIL
jgi:cation diffusion facilitator CzcD-associated flavoprotein CzcO